MTDYQLYFDLDNTLLPTARLTFLGSLQNLVQKFKRGDGSFDRKSFHKSAEEWYRRGVTRDLRLQRLLETIPYPKSIITNASYTHAFLSLKNLDISHLFMSMVDANMISRLKPDPEPYNLAELRLREILPRHSKSKPSRRVFYDDLVENLEYPHTQGWCTVLIGESQKYRHPHVTHSYPDIYHALEDFILHMRRGKIY